MVFRATVNGASGWINGRPMSQQNRTQTLAAATGSIQNDVDEVRVTHTPTAAVTDLEYSNALKAYGRKSIIVYDAGGAAGTNNITIKDTANNVLGVINEDGGAVLIMCDGTNIDVIPLA